MWRPKVTIKLFKYEYEYIQDSILSSAKNHIPKWYKDAERYVGGKPKFRPSKNTTIKACIPFLDSLTTGYMVTLPMDVLVEKTFEGIQVTWPTSPDPLQTRDVDSSLTFPVPAGHLEGRFIWKVNINFELPKGYSALFVHPLNRYDLPFTTVSGIVDADMGMYPGNLPFFLKEDFEGIIVKGTPLAQIIPFKRDNWKLTHTPGLKERTNKLALITMTTIEGWYKKNGWKKKDFD